MIGSSEFAVTEALYQAHANYNAAYLDRALRRPMLRVVPGLGALGMWMPELREIRIQAAHAANDPWIEVLGTLRHEMAHQFVDEVLRPTGPPEPPHGPAFRRACQLLRVVPTARGGHDPSFEENERLLSRVQKLFALGASPNEHEAEVAMRKARELIVLHELKDVREQRPRHFECRQLGPIKARHAAWEYRLGSVLVEFFCVKTIWHSAFDARANKSGSVLLVYGTERNMLMAEFVYGALTGMLDPLWTAYKRAHGVQRNSQRLRYFEGVLSGFRERLREQDRAMPASRELIALGDRDLSDYYRWQNPRVRSAIIGTSRGTEAWAAGRSDGRKVTLNQPVSGAQGPIRSIAGPSSNT